MDISPSPSIFNVSFSDSISLPGLKRTLSLKGTFSKTPPSTPVPSNGTYEALRERERERERENFREIQRQGREREREEREVVLEYFDGAWLVGCELSHQLVNLECNFSTHTQTQTHTQAQTHTHTHIRTHASTNSHAHADTDTPKHKLIRTHTHTSS